MEDVVDQGVSHSGNYVGLIESRKLKYCYKHVSSFASWAADSNENNKMIKCINYFK